jgi:hypothetical protein
MKYLLAAVFSQKMKVSGVEEGIPGAEVPRKA